MLLPISVVVLGLNSALKRRLVFYPAHTVFTPNKGFFETLFDALFRREDRKAADSPEVSPTKPEMEKILVFGGTGRTGREIVAALQMSGRQVVVPSRRPHAAAHGISESFRRYSSAPLKVVCEVDLTKPETLTADLFRGVEAVVSCVGPTSSPEGDGQFQSSKSIDYDGNLNLITVASKYGQ